MLLGLAQRAEPESGRCHSRSSCLQQGEQGSANHQGTGGSWEFERNAVTPRRAHRQMSEGSQTNPPGRPTDASSWISLMAAPRVYGGETGMLRCPNMAATRWGSLTRGNGLDERRSPGAAFDRASATQQETRGEHCVASPVTRIMGRYMVDEGSSGRCGSQ